MREAFTDLQERVAGVIEKHTKNSPITGAQIANEVGLKPRNTGKEGADMRAIINALRVKGYPICADGNGYWWPETKAELEEYIASLEGRIADQQKALSGLKLGFERIQKVCKCHCHNTMLPLEHETRCCDKMHGEIKPSRLF